MLAVLVSTDDPGLTIFPTHRVRRPAGHRSDGRRAVRTRGRARAARGRAGARSAAVAYRGGRRATSCGAGPSSTSSSSTGSRPRGRSRTRRCEERSGGRPRRGRRAFLLRAPTSRARSSRSRARGETMPQKSTYFFPKPLSGLLFHPVDLVTDWLAVCRARASRTSEDVLESCRPAPSGSPCPARRGRRRHDRDRRGGGGRGRRAGSRRRASTSCSSRRSSACGRSATAASRRVVVDPIDGSVNAKRGIPFFSLSLAVADGPDDGRRRLRLRLRLRRRARSGWPSAGSGAFLDGAPLGAAGPEGRRSRSSSLEATTHASAIADRAPAAASASPAAPRDGLARALALPSGRGSRGRASAPEAGSVGRHRCRPAARARARARDRAVRGSAVRRAPLDLGSARGVVAAGRRLCAQSRPHCADGEAGRRTAASADRFGAG